MPLHPLAFFCATYLKLEMQHVYRQIRAVTEFSPWVLTQKVEHLSRFPMGSLVRIPRSRWRFLARFQEQCTQRPWQMGRSEVQRMLQALEQRQSALLHLFFGTTAIHALPLLRQVSIPVVISFHGADVGGVMTHPGYAKARAEMFERARLIFCRSQALAQTVLRLGASQAKIRVTPTWVPEIQFQSRVLPEDGRLHFVQVGRLIPKKGVGTTLEAFAQVSRRFPQARLTLAGTGSLQERLEQQVIELGLEQQVRFAGFLTQPELQLLLKTAHCFVHPSEPEGEDQEGIPNALLEAMGTGLVSIATSNGGIPEVIDSGVNGWLIPEKSPQALAEAMIHVVEAPSQYAQCSKAAYQTIQERFSAPVISQVLNRCYWEALKGPLPH